MSVLRPLRAARPSRAACVRCGLLSFDAPPCVLGGGWPV